MKPQDHSDTTLLVWSDWLEENGEEQKAHDLREEIANPPANRWSNDYRYHDGVGSIGGFVVGGDYAGGVVGGIIGENVSDGHGFYIGGAGIGGDTVGGIG